MGSQSSHKILMIAPRYSRIKNFCLRRWPSMQGGLLPYRRRVRMQLRASNMRAPFGRTYWSDPVQLDSLGGAAVVSVPCPLAGPSSMMPDPRSAYMLSVTANQVCPS